jgi:hypothetical protein
MIQLMPGKVIPFPKRPAPEPNDDRALVEVHRCDQREALVIKGLFESEGIPVVVRSRIAHSVHPFTVGAQGEVTLLVPGAHVGRTRVLLWDSRHRPHPPDLRSVPGTR